MAELELEPVDLSGYPPELLGSAGADDEDPDPDGDDYGEDLRRAGRRRRAPRIR